MRGRGRNPRKKHTYVFAKTHKTRIANKKKCFLPHFTLGAGGRVNPKTQKNTSFALGMRRACVLARMVHCTEAIA